MKKLTVVHLYSSFFLSRGLETLSECGSLIVSLWLCEITERKMEAKPTEISGSKMFGGYNKRFKHFSPTLGCSMTFHVYFPPLPSPSHKFPVSPSISPFRNIYPLLLLIVWVDSFPRVLQFLQVFDNFGVHSLFLIYPFLIILSYLEAQFHKPKIKAIYFIGFSNLGKFSLKMNAEDRN